MSNDSSPPSPIQNIQKIDFRMVDFGKVHDEFLFKKGLPHNNLNITPASPNTNPISSLHVAVPDAGPIGPITLTPTAWSPANLNRSASMSASSVASSGSSSTTRSDVTAFHLGSTTDVTDGGEYMGKGRCVFHPDPKSHPFDERVLTIMGSVKIGRAVAKSAPSPFNALFDCKVLSRNHALLSYDNGKFWLRDTKSSNGTFVNNNRLSSANSESAPKDIYSGDQVQFGVDVIENSRRMTHGCIIATIKLYHPSGEEAVKPSEEGDQQDSGSTNQLTTISTSQLVQLGHCLKEALAREDELNKKIDFLQQVLVQTKESTELGWKSMMEEDRLLSRVECLQTKLDVMYTAYTNKHSEDIMSFLKKDLENIFKDRESYESEAKNRLLQSEQRVIEANGKVSQLEQSLAAAQADIRFLTTSNEQFTTDVTDLSTKYDSSIKEYEELMVKLKATEETITQMKEEVELAKEESEQKVTQFRTKENDLETQLQNLQNKLDAAINVKPEATVDAVEVKAKLVQAEQKVIEANDKVTQLEGSLVTSQEQVTLLTQSNDQFTSDITLLSTKYDATIKEYEDLMSRFNVTEHVVAQMKEDLDSSRTECEQKVIEFKSRESDLETRLLNLQNKLDAELKAKTIPIPVSVSVSPQMKEELSSLRSLLTIRDQELVQREDDMRNLKESLDKALAQREEEGRKLMSKQDELTSSQSWNNKADEHPIPTRLGGHLSPVPIELLFLFHFPFGSPIQTGKR